MPGTLNHCQTRISKTPGEEETTHRITLPRREMNRTGFRPLRSPNALHHPTLMKLITAEANVVPDRGDWL
jgi:hypothetical protein